MAKNTTASLTLNNLYVLFITIFHFTLCQRSARLVSVTRAELSHPLACSPFLSAHSFTTNCLFSLVSFHFVHRTTETKATTREHILSNRYSRSALTLFGLYLGKYVLNIRLCQTSRRLASSSQLAQAFRSSFSRSPHAQCAHTHTLALRIRVLSRAAKCGSCVAWSHTSRSCK